MATGLIWLFRVRAVRDGGASLRALHPRAVLPPVCERARCLFDKESGREVPADGEGAFPTSYALPRALPPPG